MERVPNSTFTKDDKEIIEQISKTYNIPKTIVRKMIDTQFRFIKHQASLSTLKENKFKSVRIPYLGLFFPNPNTIRKRKVRFIQWLNKNADKRYICESCFSFQDEWKECLRCHKETLSINDPIHRAEIKDRFV